MYILLTEEKIVQEIIPTFHPALPGIPIEERYPAAFVSSLLTIDDSVSVQEGLLYDEETDTFVVPPVVELEVTESFALSPADLREQAYNTEAVIEWEDNMITITEAAQLWHYYAAEGNDKAEELTELIAAAKQAIREMYPDTEEPL